MTKLRQQLYDNVNTVFNNFLSNIESTEITENGALQLMFDYMFLITVLQDTTKSSIGQKIIETLQDQIDPINWDSYEPHLKPCVNKFYIKQSLIFGVLTSATNETYERARKVMSNQQQGQHNVLPLASQATRFTLLPIGHLTSSSVRAR
ncbi:hypothetical protein BDF21DRAFT_41427 [Thamnidium elegans]|nr:hypothetical protein BDF21DRAFT_41427 [Thamnidium elegans]